MIVIQCYIIDLGQVGELWVGLKSLEGVKDIIGVHTLKFVQSVALTSISLRCGGGGKSFYI